MADVALPIVNSIDELKSSNRVDSEKLRYTMSAGFFDVVKSVNRLSANIYGAGGGEATPSQQFLQSEPQEQQRDLLDYFNAFVSYSIKGSNERIADMEQKQRETESQLLEAERETTASIEGYKDLQGRFLAISGSQTEVFGQMSVTFSQMHTFLDGLYKIAVQDFDRAVSSDRMQTYLLQKIAQLGGLGGGGGGMLTGEAQFSGTDLETEARLKMTERLLNELESSVSMIGTSVENNLMNAQLIDLPKILDALKQELDMLKKKDSEDDTKEEQKTRQELTRLERVIEALERKTEYDKKHDIKTAGIWTGMLSYLKDIKKAQDIKAQDDLERGEGLAALFGGDPEQATSKAGTLKKWFFGILAALGITYALQQASDASYDPTKTELTKPQKDTLFDQTAKNDAEERKLKAELAAGVTDERREEINNRLEEISALNDRIKYRWDLHYRGQAVDAIEEYNREKQKWAENARKGIRPDLLPPKPTMPSLVSPAQTLSPDEAYSLMRAAPTSGAPKAGAEIDAKSSSQTAQPPVIIKQGDNNSPVTNQQIIDARVTNQTPPSADKTNKPTRLKYGLMGQ